MPENKTNIPKQTNAMQSLPIKIVEQVVENQSREIEFRTSELDLRQLQEKNALEYSNKALEGQLSDRLSQREHLKYSQKILYRISCFLIIAISTVIIVSLYLDKDPIADKIIQAIVYIFVGGVGGYGLGYNAAKDNKNGQNQNNDRYNFQPTA